MVIISLIEVNFFLLQIQIKFHCLKVFYQIETLLTFHVFVSFYLKMKFYQQDHAVLYIVQLKILQ